jgi:mRNA-degrading endonuclease toxin of MazEF toxin-antitoxin module
MPPSLDYASQAIRGAVFYLTAVEFRDKTKPKYCVLLEDYTPRADLLIVCLTTSKMDFRGYPSSVELPAKTVPGMPLDSIIQVDNWTEIHSDYLLCKKTSRYLGRLPEDKLKEVNRAILDVMADEFIFYRIAPPH